MPDTKKAGGPKRKRWSEEEIEELHQAMQVYGRNFAAILLDKRFGQSLGLYSDLDLANKYSFMCQIRDPRFAFFRETTKASPRVVHSTVSSRHVAIGSPTKEKSPAKPKSPTVSLKSSPKKAPEQGQVTQVFDVEAVEDLNDKGAAVAQFSVQFRNRKRAWLPREELPSSARLPLKRMINGLRLKLKVCEEEYARLGRIEESGSEVEEGSSEDDLQMEDDEEENGEKREIPKYSIKNVTIYGESRKDVISSSPSIRSPRKTQISWEDYLKKELPQVRSEQDDDDLEVEGEDEDGLELEMESVQEGSEDGSHQGTEDTADDSEREAEDEASSDLADAADIIYQTQMIQMTPKSSPAKTPLPVSIEPSSKPIRLTPNVPVKRVSIGEDPEERAKRVAERMAIARKTVDKKKTSAGCPIM